MSVEFSKKEIAGIATLLIVTVVGYVIYILVSILIIVFIIGSFLHLFVGLLNMDGCRWTIGYTGVQQEDCVKK